MTKFSTGLSDDSNAKAGSKGKAVLSLAVLTLSLTGLLITLSLLLPDSGERGFPAPLFIRSLFSALVFLACLPLALRFLHNFKNSSECQTGFFSSAVVMNFCEEISEVHERDEAVKKLLSLFKTELHYDSASVLLKKTDGSFHPAGSFGVSSAAEEELIKREKLLTSLLSLRGPVSLARISSEAAMSPEDVALFKKIRCESILPLVTSSGKQSGLLILGTFRPGKKAAASGAELGMLSRFAAATLYRARSSEDLKQGQLDYVQQAKTASIGTISAGIGHEVKNPLNNIRGAIGMLKLNKKHNVFQGKTKDELEKEIFEALEIMDQNIARATAVIDRFQSYAKNPQSLKMEQVSLQDAAENAIASATRELSEHSVTLERHFDPDLRPVLAEHNALEEIIVNLISNARHAIGDKGILTITTKESEMMGEVSVEDTGCGIAPDKLDKIWDPLYTTRDNQRQTDPDKVKGTGLGLFIVKETVKRFGGRITVDSILGKGTKVRVLLPFASAGQTA